MSHYPSFSWQGQGFNGGNYNPNPPFQSNPPVPHSFPLTLAPSQVKADITFKIRYVQDVRRMTLPGSTSFLQLEEQIKNLFGDHQLLSSHSIKYKDDEGDWVTMSSDLELKEATRIIDNKRLIQLSVEPKNAAVQQVSDALFQMQKDPQLLQSLIQSLSNSRISPSTPPSYSLSSSVVSPPQQPFPSQTPFSPVSPFANLNKFAEPSTPEKPKENFAPVVLPQSQNNQPNQVWCDGCSVKLLYQSHKCALCPDYDLCDICFQKRAISKVHHHDNFYQRGLDWGKPIDTKASQPRQPVFSHQPQQQNNQPASPFQQNPAPEKQENQPNITSSPMLQPPIFSPPQVSQPQVAPVQPSSPFQPQQVADGNKNTFRHSARCDSCLTQIVGIRHKCQGCDDYDLCDSCFATRTHNNSHTFETMTGNADHQDSPKLEAPVCQTSIAAPPPSNISSWGDLPQINPPSPQVSVAPEVVAPVVEPPKPQEPQVSHVNNEVTNTFAQPQLDAPSSPSPIGLDRKTIEDGMKQLHDMGFHDRHQNLQALVKSNGNVVAAITSLLN